MEEHKRIHGVLQTEQLAGTEMLTDKENSGLYGILFCEQIIDADLQRYTYVSLKDETDAHL
jgi:hypothetical protein